MEAVGRTRQESAASSPFSPWPWPLARAPGLSSVRFPSSGRLSQVRGMGPLAQMSEAPPMRTQTARPDLTPRQLEILRALLEGGSNRDIAVQLGVREQTVKNQLTIMYQEIGVENRLQLALEGLRLLQKAS